MFKVESIIKRHFMVALLHLDNFENYNAFVPSNGYHCFFLAFMSCHGPQSPEAKVQGHLKTQVVVS